MEPGGLRLKGQYPGFITTDRQTECLFHCRVVIHCPALIDVENATRDSNETHYDKRVIYSCLPGYQFPDKLKQKVVQCTENETWTELPPPCEGFAYFYLVYPVLFDITQWRRSTCNGSKSAKVIAKVIAKIRKVGCLPSPSCPNLPSLPSFILTCLPPSGPHSINPASLVEHFELPAGSGGA